MMANIPHTTISSINTAKYITYSIRSVTEMCFVREYALHKGLFYSVNVPI